MLKTWFSLSRWENYLLLAVAAVACLIVVTLRADAQSQASFLHFAAPHRHVLQATPRNHEPKWIARHAWIVRQANTRAYDVMLLGDSITQGWDYNRQAWRHAFPGISALNAGIASDRVEHVLWRVEHGLLSRFKPRVIILLAGVNNLASDSPDAIEGGMARVIVQIRHRSPATKILLLGLLPSGESPDHPRRAQIRAVNERLLHLADGDMVHYLDIGASFLTLDGHLPKSVAFDGLHLTHSGYRIWTQAMAAPLKALLH